MSSITIYLTNSSGVPLSGQTVKLRRAGLDNFGTDYLTMVDVAGKPGKYKTVDAYVSDRYKVWVNGAEDESFGGPDGLEITLQSDILLKSGGTMTGVINMNGQKITGLTTPTENTDATPKAWVDNEKLAKSGGTLSGDINMDGHKVKSLADATEAGDAVSKQFLEQKLTDENYAGKTTNNVFSGTNSFLDETSFNVPPLCDVDPEGDNDLTRKVWVLSEINNAVLSPYQESLNIVRLIPEGSTQTGKVYTSWAAANAYLSGVASSSRRMTLEIRGAGTTGAKIAPGDFLPYVSYKGINHNLLLNMTGTSNFSTTPASSVISDLTLYSDDPDLELYFAGYIFNNCVFDLTALTSFELYLCELRNCILKIAGGEATYTNCKGSNNSSNTDMGDTIGGFGGRNIDDL
jgi:hypothetical protein